MSEEERVSISAAAEQLGISSATLRRWEGQLGLPVDRFGPGQSRMYTETEIEFLRRVKEFKEEEGCTMELIAKFLKKFGTLPDLAEAEVAIALTSPGFTSIANLSEEDQNAIREQLEIMVKGATEGLQNYVDDKIESVNNSLGHTLDKAVAQIDRMSELRSRELTEMFTEIANRKKNRSFIRKMFGS